MYRGGQVGKLNQYSVNLAQIQLLFAPRSQQIPPPSPSSYPVILSIENHCSVPQQKKMAEYLSDILGDKLDLSSVKAHDGGHLPSPESLRGKILVKVRAQLSLCVDCLSCCGTGKLQGRCR